MDNSVYIVSGVRTAIGSFNGCFQTTPAKVLGAVVIREALSKANISKSDVDEVIMGQVLTAGQGQNTARQSAYGCELPLSVPATTINMMCGSGLKAVQLGYAAIASGEANVVVCGGQENMTMAQYTACVRNQKLGSLELKDTILCDGLTDAFENIHMGETAEHLAKKYNVSRQRQDHYATTSQNQAEKAILSGFFKQEIVAVQVNKTQKIILEDEFPRFGTTAEKLSKLRPCFVKNDLPQPGTVTPGNASGINDGAAAVVLCGGRFLRDRALCPLAKIIGFAHAGVKPIEMGLAPVDAIKNLLQKVRWSKDEVDLYEINEAFAVQADLVQQQLGLPGEKVNVNGGAIALGHPIGASGARILVTLLHSLQRLSLSKGIAALCIGGGMGIAIAIEVVSSEALAVINE